jgi:hypothetical protein
MKSKIIAFVTISVAIALSMGANSAQAHRHNGYDNYGYDNWNHGFWGHRHHHHFVDQNEELDTIPTRDIAINAPQAIDNSGDIRNAEANAAASNDCGDRSLCTATNTNVIGNGNTVIVNQPIASPQDSGSDY